MARFFSRRAKRNTQGVVTWVALFCVLCIPGDVVRPACAKSETSAEPEALGKALEEVGYFNFKAAYKLYDRVMKSTAKGSPVWQKAAYGRAVCAQQITPAKKHLIEEARELFETLVEKYPESRFAPRAMLNLGRIYELRDYAGDKVDPAKARAVYGKVIENWPGKPIASEATLRLAAAYVQTYNAKMAEKGVAVLEKWLAAHPDDPLAPAMYQYLGDSYRFPLKKYAKAVENYIKADEAGLFSKGWITQYYWRIAVIADRYVSSEKIGAESGREVAIRYYTKIITDYPYSGKSFEAWLALKRMKAEIPDVPVVKRFEESRRIGARKGSREKGEENRK